MKRVGLVIENKSWSWK